MSIGDLWYRLGKVRKSYWLGVIAFLGIAFETVRLFHDIYGIGFLNPDLIRIAGIYRYFEIFLTGGFVFVSVHLIGSSVFTSDRANTTYFKNQMGILVGLATISILTLDLLGSILAVIFLTGINSIFDSPTAGIRTRFYDSFIGLILAYSFFSIESYLTFMEALVLLGFLLQGRPISQRIWDVIIAIEERVLLLNEQAGSSAHGVITALFIYSVLLLSSQIFVIPGAAGGIILVLGGDTIPGVLANLLLGRLGYPLIIISGIVLFISTLAVSIGMATFWISRFPRIAKYIEYHTNDQSDPGPIPRTEHGFPEFSTITYWLLAIPLAAVGMLPVRSMVNATNVGGQIWIPYYKNGQKQIGQMNPSEAIFVVIISIVGIGLVIHMINRSEPYKPLPRSVKGEHTRMFIPLILTVGILTVVGFVWKTTLVYEASVILIGYAVFLGSHYITR